MEPDAMLRSRGHGSYLHTAARGLADDYGLSVSLRGSTASLVADWDAHVASYLSSTAAAAPRGRDAPEMETAGTGDGFLLRHGAGRWSNGFRVECFDNIFDRERTGSSTSTGEQFELQSTGRSDLLCGSNCDTVLFTAGAPVEGATFHGGGTRKAAADVFLGRANRGRRMARLRLAIELGPMYWWQELMDLVAYLWKGSPRPRSRDAWSWAGVVGVPISQDDDTCAICGTLVCLEARHRLAFERLYGFKSFPYRIPPESVADVKNLCRGGGVWTAKGGADEQDVLEVIQLVGGCLVADVPGWRPCKLRVKSWTFHRTSSQRPMPASRIARMLLTEGPVLGAIVKGKDYYADGWQDRVYRGVARGQKGSEHLVVCMGYRHDPDLQIEIMDNHEPDGPVRWIATTAFIGFCEIQVEPLDAGELKVSKPSWWRCVLRRVRAILGGRFCRKK